MTGVNYSVDEVLQKDLVDIAESLPDAEQFRDRTILVSGATGLVGSYLTRVLLAVNRIRGVNLKVIAMIRDPEKANKMFADHQSDPALQLLVADITRKIRFDDRVDYIIHTASVTSSKIFVTHPVRTIHTMLDGTMNILDLAVEKAAKGVVYVSSMEVYGITDPEAESISESDLGFIDILNVRSSYSEGKRMAECLCAAYASEFDLNVKIARLAQTFGAGVSLEENRVFAQFAKSVINGQDIMLNTAGRSMGNYCYIGDTVKALILLLTRGQSGEAYNISNEASNLSIRDMALLVADEIAQGSIKVRFNDPAEADRHGYAPDVKMKLNAGKMRALGWKPEIGLAESYRRMISSMRIRMQ